MRVLLIAIFVLLILALPVVAQSGAGGELAVEQSIPFGTVTGKLLLLGNYLVFVDDQQPAASFVIAKSVIENLTAEGTSVTIQTRESIRDRSGEVRRLSFRVVSGGDPALVTSWYGSGVSGVPASPGRSAASGPSASSAGTYQARHNHRIGSCRGRLLVTPDMLTFESVDAVDHSRRWEYRSIKEIRNPNPYELQITPFSGGSYKLLLDGSSMDPAAFKQIVDRVTAARTGR
jgi:hypothetical protein